MNKNNIFILFTVSLFLALLTPKLVQEGMFLDGVTYSAISKNMAHGLGSCWSPHYTKTLYADFYEHPPLVFIIQSGFFRLFGNAFYTERIFTLLSAILTGIGIILCWRLLVKETELKKYSWLPVLLWLSVPLVSWAYKNNILENTMGVFTIFSTYLIIKALVEKRILLLLLGGICIVFAFLSKGFTGIFPLVIPFLYGFVYGKLKKSLWYTVYLFSFIFLFSAILLVLFPDIQHNISFYIQQQVLPALNKQREVTTNFRLKIILELIFDLSIPLLFVIYFAVMQWRKNKHLKLFFKSKNFFFFLLLGICASLPLLISLKQRKFYLIPSIPLYALSLSFLIISHFKISTEKMPATAFKWIRAFSVILLFAVFSFSVIKTGDFSRDKDKIKDVYAISKHIPEGTIISTTKDLCSEWTLIAYMSRIGYLSLDCNHEREYLLTTRKNKNLPKGYRKTNLALIKYNLYKKELQPKN